MANEVETDAAGTAGNKTKKSRYSPAEIQSLWDYLKKHPNGRGMSWKEYAELHKKKFRERTIGSMQVTCANLKKAAKAAAAAPAVPKRRN